MLFRSRAETAGGRGGKLRSHGGERINRGAEGKAERFPHTGSVPTSTHQPERLVCSTAREVGGWELRIGAGGVVLEAGPGGLVLEAGPGGLVLEAGPGGLVLEAGPGALGLQVGPWLQSHCSGPPEEIGRASCRERVSSPV